MHDPSITLEKCRQALGALGLTGSLALQEIGAWALGLLLMTAGLCI